MPSSVHTLATSLPPGLIFGVVVVAIWAFGLIVNKKPPADLKKPTVRTSELAETRRRMLEQLNAQKLPVTPRTFLKKVKRKAAAPPPMPPVTPRPMLQPTARVVTSPPSLAPQRRAANNETARNVRLLLQPASIGEAFVLSEILGKPKGFH